MTRSTWAVMVCMAVTAAGCSSEGMGSGLLGAATGAGATGAGYEINAKRQLDRLNRDLETGKITEQEYQIRKDQIQRGSLVY